MNNSCICSDTSLGENYKGHPHASGHKPEYQLGVRKEFFPENSVAFVGTLGGTCVYGRGDVTPSSGAFGIVHWLAT